MPQVIAICCCCPKGKRMTVSEFLCLQKLKDDRISLQKKKKKSKYMYMCSNCDWFNMPFETYARADAKFFS